MLQDKPPFGRNTRALALVGALAFAGVVLAWSHRIPEGREQPLGLTIFITAGLLVLIPAIVAYVVVTYWRALEEAAREARKWAWYWGGSVGILPGMVIASSRTLGVQWAGRLGFAEPRKLIQFGALIVLTSMVVSYLVAWGVWWLRKR